MTHASVSFEGAPPIPDWIAADYPFRRRIAKMDGRRIHFVDDGDGPIVVLMHGNPTWSYLWRKVIDRLLPGGFRCIAPDLLGLGLSDKPTQVKAHSLDMHIDVMRRLFDALEMSEVTIVGQDWGGPIVTGAAARSNVKVRAVVYANTQVLAPDKRIKATAFHRFSHAPVVSTLAFRGFNFPVPILHRIQGDPSTIGPAEKRAYAWPLKGWSNRAAPLAMARMVPNSLDHPSIEPLRECDRFVRDFHGKAALVWGMKDPILGRSWKRLQEALPQAAITKSSAGHFLQEEVPDELAAAIRSVSQ